MKMRYKALFLDLDGTILDTIDDIKEAVNYSLDKHGFKVRTKEEIRKSLGYGSPHLIKTSLVKEVDENTFKKVFDDYKTYYENHVDILTKPYPGCVEILTKLKQKGMKLALITNKPHDIALQLVDIYFKGLFDVIYGQMSKIKSKPDPESVYLALDDLGLKKEEILFIGDSLADHKTAVNANVDYLICSYGFETKIVLKENGIKNIIDSFYEMEEYI